MVDVSTQVAPIMVVAFSLEEAKQAEFDRFYQHQYLPKLLSVAPEIKNIVRYQSDRTVPATASEAPSGEFLTIYELASTESLKITDEIFTRTGLAEEMAEFKRWKEQVSGFSRINYQLTYEHARRPAAGRFTNQHLLYFTSEVLPEKVEEFRQWYQVSYLPRLMADIPSISALRRYSSWSGNAVSAEKADTAIAKPDARTEAEGEAKVAGKPSKPVGQFLTVMESANELTLASSIERMAAPHRVQENEAMQKWLDTAVKFTASNTYKPIFSMPA